MSIQEAFSHREPLIVSTVTPEGKAHSNAMLSLGIIDGKILIGLCFLNTTFKNLSKNTSISLATCGKKGYFRVKGTVEMFESGKYFDLANSLSNPPMPRRAILVNIKEAFDLDKMVAVKL